MTNSLDIGALAKVELHQHLDCSLSFDVVSRLKPGMTRAEFETTFIPPNKCKSLAEILGCIAPSLELMQTADALRLIVADLVAQLRRDGVIYAEIRFAPLLHLGAGLKAAQVVEIVEESLSRAVHETGIEARLILCTLRHFSEAQSLETVQLVERFKGSRVAALDLAADEAGFPIDAHVRAFEFAMEHDIPRTAHAGEGRGAESIRETLAHLKPSRIGHGVRSVEDPQLVELLKRDKIHLEVCPSCNVQIDIYDAYADHPIDRLYSSGVSVGINTDGRTLANVTLTEEYRRLQSVFGWDRERFLNCNVAALQAAFLPHAMKRALQDKLIASYS